MSLGASRAVLRRQAFLANRQIAYSRSASTASEAAKGASDAAAVAKEKLGPAAAKAQEGLTKVASSAGNALGAVGRTLGGIGGRTGRLIGAVQSAIPPTVYYGKVAAEFSKLVFKGRKLSPPSTEVFQQYFNNALKSVRNPSELPSARNALSQIRNADRQQITSAAIIAAEVLGFFTVGEIIGRFKLVGYRSSAPEHHD